MQITNQRRMVASILSKREAALLVFTAYGFIRITLTRYLAQFRRRTFANLLMKVSRPDRLRN